MPVWGDEPLPRERLAAFFPNLPLAGKGHNLEARGPTHGCFGPGYPSDRESLYFWKFFGHRSTPFRQTFRTIGNQIKLA